MCCTCSWRRWESSSVVEPSHLSSLSCVSSTTDLVPWPIQLGGCPASPSRERLFLKGSAENVGVCVCQSSSQLCQDKLWFSAICSLSFSVNSKSVFLWGKFLSVLLINDYYSALNHIIAWMSWPFKVLRAAFAHEELHEVWVGWYFLFLYVSVRELVLLSSAVLKSNDMHRYANNCCIHLLKPSSYMCWIL